MIMPTPGLAGSGYPATGNVVRGNNAHGTRLADFAAVVTTPADRNCFADNQFGTSAPRDIEQVMPCAGASVGDPNDGLLGLDQFLDVAKNPPGRDYKDTPVPGPQRNLPKAKTAPARPAGAPPRVAVDTISRPG
jgi:hypothetical protein